MRMIKSRLHLIKNSFVFPACHATLRTWRAVSLSRTLLAFRTPILTDVQAAVNGRSCTQRCVWSRVRPGLQSSWTSSVRTRLHRPQLVSYGNCLPMGSGLRRERESGTQRRFNSPLKLGPEHSDCLVRRTKRTPTQIAERTRPVPPVLRQGVACKASGDSAVHAPVQSGIDAIALWKNLKEQVNGSTWAARCPANTPAGAPLHGRLRVSARRHIDLPQCEGRKSKI
jgi:hypothetical protein